MCTINGMTFRAPPVLTTIRDTSASQMTLHLLLNH